jgi:hypothetical protein
MTEQEELLKKYQEEVERCYNLAQRLDTLYPEFAGTRTGTPSDRMKHVLYAMGILK